MKTTQNVKKIIAENSILFDQVEPPKNILGYYESSNDDNCILISDSKSLRNNEVCFSWRDRALFHLYKYQWTNEW